MEDCRKRGHPDAIFIFIFTYYSDEVIIAKLVDLAKRATTFLRALWEFFTSHRVNVMKGFKCFGV